MTAPDADLSATLAGIRERSAKAEARQGDSAEWLGAALRSAMEDVPRLIAVFDAVLKLADDWDAEEAECLYSRESRTRAS